MRITRIAVTSFMALSLAWSAVAAEKSPRGYVASDLASAQASALFIVSSQAVVRPQVAYNPMPSPIVTSGSNYPGLSNLGTMGVDVASGLVAGALLNAAAREEAMSQATRNWAWLRTGQCTTDADAPMRAALQQALLQAGITNTAQNAVLETRDLDEVVTSTGQRLVILHSTSFTPELSSVQTTLQVSAWAPSAQARRSQEKPVWQNILVVSSAPMSLPAKTEQDKAVLLAALDQAYADSGNQARVLRVNAAKHNADPNERRVAVTALREHTALVRYARQQNWTGGIDAMRRALFWGDDHCALVDQAVQDNATEAGRLLQVMFAEQLPAEGEVVSAPAVVAQSQDQQQGMIYPRSEPRELEALKGYHLSRLAGTLVSTAFSYRVLEAEEGTQ